MTIRTAEPSPLTRAKLTDFLNLIANLFAPFTLSYFLSHFIVCADAAITATNIIDFQLLMHIGVADDINVQIKENHYAMA